MNAKTARLIAISGPDNKRNSHHREERRERMRCEKAVLAIFHLIEEAADRSEQQIDILCDREPCLWDVNWYLYFDHVLMPLEQAGFSCQVEHISGFDTRHGYFSPFNDFHFRVRWDGETYQARYLKTFAPSAAKIHTK